MRKLLPVLPAAALFGVLTIAPAAQAGWVLEGSVGKPYQLTEPKGWQPTNIMLAPGYEVLEMLRFQLGVAAQLADVDNSKFAAQLRPMIGLFPPIIPLFARATFAIQNLGRDAKIGTGISGGLKLSVLGVGVFVEGGYLPVFDGGTKSAIEGRLGAFIAF